MHSRCESIVMVMVDRDFLCSKIWPLLDWWWHFQICSGRAMVLVYNNGQIMVMYGQQKWSNYAQDLSRHRILWGCYWLLASSKTLDVVQPNFWLTSVSSYQSKSWQCRLPWTLHLGILPRSRVALPTNCRLRWGRWSSTSSVLALQRDAYPLYIAPWDHLCGGW